MVFEGHILIAFLHRIHYIFDAKILLDFKQKNYQTQGDNFMQTLTTNRIPTREEREAYGQTARAIYESVREQLEKDHWGEYTVIHPGNGGYIVSADEEEALEQMRAKYPGVLFFSIRIGYRSLYHFGSSGLSDGKHS